MRPALIALALAAAAVLPAGADTLGQAAPAPAAPVSPSQKLGEARSLFAAKSYADAADVLSALLYPREQLALPSELVEAHLLLGASFVETGRPGEAKEEFRKVLQLEPAETLDATVVSPNVIRVFEETKSDVEAQQRKLDEERRKEEERRRVETYLKSLRVYETHPYFVNFVPFGAGQFQDHRPFKGIVLAGSEAATFGVSAGIWLYLVGTYGFGGQVPTRSEAETVQKLEYVEVGSGIAFLVLYGYGVFDALYHYKPRALIQGDESLLPGDLKPGKPKKTSLLDRIHLAPVPLPGGAGIAIGWEN